MHCEIDNHLGAHNVSCHIGKCVDFSLTAHIAKWQDMNSNQKPNKHWVSQPVDQPVALIVWTNVQYVGCAEARCICYVFFALLREKNWVRKWLVDFTVYIIYTDIRVYVSGCPCIEFIFICSFTIQAKKAHLMWWRKIQIQNVPTIVSWIFFSSSLPTTYSDTEQKSERELAC